MIEERNDLILKHLLDIRAKQDEQSRVLDAHTARLDEIDKQLNRLSKVVTFSLGQTPETQFRQVEQEKRVHELFEKIEQLLSPKEPV